MGEPKTTIRTARPFCAVLSLVGVIMLASCSTNTSGQSASSYRGLDLPSVLRDVGRNPDRRGAAETSCTAQMDRKNSAFPFEYLVVGLLDIAEADAKSAFCQALLEGAIAGEITASDLARFQQPRSQRGVEPLGDLLRKLLAAHLRLTSRQA